MFKLFFNSLVGNPIEKEVSRKCLLVYNKLPSISLKKLFLNNCFLAGGSIRSLYINVKVKDWDFFFKNKESALLFAMEIDKHVNKVNLIYKSQHTISLNIDNNIIQFCSDKYSGDPNEVVAKFDYTNSMAFFDIKDDKLVLTDKFKHACDNKLIQYNPSAYNPEIALNRYSKFRDEGWQCDPEGYNSIDFLIRKSSPAKKDSEPSLEQ